MVLKLQVMAASGKNVTIMKEKLVGLINQVQDCGYDMTGVVEMNYIENDTLADYLLANGVVVQDHTEISDESLKKLRNASLAVLHEEPTIEVVQEWISVAEKLPNYFEHVLINVPRDKPFATVHEAYLRKDGLWNTGLYRYNKEDVTHWMPLPQPPVDMSRMFENVSADDLRAYREKTKPPKGE